MKFTKPSVALIARPQLIDDAVKRYLQSVGGESWLDRATGTDAEKLIEFGGRLCYRSWEPGLNANVTRVREDSKAYLENIIEVGHGSVTEHAQFSFVFKDVSRVFTHEIVRHRAGCAVSQESLRYVRLEDLSVWVPQIFQEDLYGGVPTMPDGSTVNDTVVSVVEQLESLQVELGKAFKLDDEGVPFAYKKAVTSAMRRLAPIGLSTTMLWSANVRTLRHTIEMRTSRHAEQEVRLVFNDVANLMQKEAPSLFGDYKKVMYDGAYEWVPRSRKV